MNRKIILLFVSMLLITTGLPTMSTMNETSEDLNQTEYWALLIAVGVYADDPEQNRPLMLEEVDDFHNVLLSSPWWHEDHIKVIKGEDATVNNIIDGLRWLDSKEDSEDISLVYITTHGFPISFDVPPGDEADGMDEALASYWFFAYPLLFIYDDELNFLLNRLESHGVCLIVDSCYAGGFNDPPERTMAPTARVPSTLNDETQSVTEWMEGFAEEIRGQGRVVLMASCEDEVSYSGGFAPYLIDGLRGYADSNNDGVISAEETFYYTEPRTSRQHPTMYDGFPGELPLITSSVEADAQSNSYTVALNKNSEGEQPKICKTSLLSENATVCGYITDSDTGYPIENAYIELSSGDYWEGYWNITTSDSSGFYRFNVAPGNVRLFVSAQGYMNKRPGTFTVNEYETVWMNISLDPPPLENATVSGFITDAETGIPVEDASVIIQWGSWRNGYWNETMSDSSGFYYINVAPGEIWLLFNSSDYIPKYSEDYHIHEFELVWINVSLHPRPPENSVVTGYVTDSATSDPIDNARVDLEWYDDKGNNLEYEAVTDESGFYSINVAAGETYIEIRASNYREEYTYRNDAAENEVLWINVSMDLDSIQVDILKPLCAIYGNNQRIIPSSKCVILGDIDVEAFIHDFWFRSRGNDAVKVEFYVDGVLKETVYSEPFTWFWSEKSIGQHSLQVIAYDEAGHTATDEITVVRIL